MNVQAKEPIPLKPKDYATDQEVRWCPGCGDYAILNGVQRALADMGAERENTVFVSGIGCSSRFPYYMSTYGFHTIHGRAPAIATGVKMANPELSVWVVSGDGDGLSIGGNHLMHAIRRNVNLNYMLFNNEIYGLTKGQYSPTSRVGTRTPSTPMGSVDAPVNACELALGVGARFVARGVDTQQKQLPGILKRVAEHQGFSFLEIFQNCIVYNDAVFADFTEKPVVEDRQVVCEHGKPLIFGKEKNQGLRIKPGTLELEVVTIGEDGVAESDILIHDEKSRILAHMLASMPMQGFPMAMGILYCDPAPSYELAVGAQNQQAFDTRPKADLNEMLRGGHTWTVTG